MSANLQSSVPQTSGRTRGCRPESPVALVTGASGGFGRSLAVHLDALGFRVAVHYNSSEVAARETAALLHNNSVIIGGDVSSWDDASRIHAEVVNALGSVDVLVNNGGIRHDSLMAMQDPEQWRAVIETNLVGAFHLARLCLPPMLMNRWGRVVNIVSPSGLIATPGQTAYAASKAGVVGMTRTLAAECAARGVTVNALSPGFMITNMTETLPEKVKDGIRTKCPMRRFGTTDEIARAIGFFIETDYMTGQVVSIDGGVSIT
ncbi:3-oxoacyl-ACP reductase [Rathayibacter tritici]|uniref:3-oxoacyl-ACP reductase family protein n=1 Tax=Rathayibacter tritici TaxID=33888 RepID=UPI000CE7C987|nr:3-oxoacyl-ACP reductase family protein [Rathayibacter tritici]PPF66068.1 3-oxoacyl-ACP reductase [Rathayibacter tritici]PPG06637.1 3-oxoacyl-ACP reductase [Rathayibacter tritici]